MSNIELKVVALGDFSSVNTQIKSLQAQVDLLKKGAAGIGLSPNISSQLKGIQSDFNSALMSSGNFTKSQVQLTSETAKFGKALESGKLSLGQYFGIITNKSGESKKAVQALAVEQVKLNNSIIQTDITKQGVYSVYTPTKINEISHSTEIAAAKQNIYNLAVKEGSNQLINFGKNTQWAGRQLTVGLAMPAILFGSQAVNAFKAVNTELTRLQRLYGLGLKPPSQAAINQISGQVLNLGKNIASSMGIAQSDTVKVAANFAAMGKEGQALLDVTTQTQRLSKLGALDATQATNTIVSLQNVYKVSTADLGNAVNFLSSMQKQTTMSLQDMTDAIPRVGPIMAQLGGNYKDTAVMLLAMREAGIPAAQSANALKSAIASIIAPTSAANKEFASFGINLNTIKSAGTPVQMVEALQSSLAKIAPLAREQLIEKLFGKFQFARVSALLDNFGKVGSQTQNALKVAGATNAQLAALAGQEMQQATESTTAKWQRSIETLKADLYPIGQKILEVGTKIIDFGQKIADFFNKLPGPIKSGLGILLTLGVISGPIIMITGLLANLVGQGMKVGYSLLGLIDGTKKWKDLMTPASIAAKTATQVFNDGLLSNVASVDALNAALQRMIVSLSEINMGSVATAGGALGSIEKAAAVELASGQLILPGMASGGIVPGSGNKDSFPAMLMPGEAVIPKAQAQQHSALITGLISGNIPGYAHGLDPNGNKVIVQKGHAYSSHGSDILDKATALLPTQSRLNSVNDVTKGVMIGMTDTLNQSVRSRAKGLSSSGVASELERYQSLTGEGGANLDPMADLKNIAQKLGADMSKARPQLDKAYQDMIIALKTGPEQMFGKNPGQMGLEEWMEAQLKPVLSNIQTKFGGSLSSTLERVASTRGAQITPNGIKKSGATGSTYWINDSGDLVPFDLSGTGLAKSNVSTSGSKAIGSITSLKEKGAELGAAIDIGARSKQGIDAHSPSLKAEQTALDYTEGLHIGLDEGLNSPVGQSRIQNTFNKAFGANSKISGMMNKFSNLGFMGRAGLGMALGSVTQMASPLLRSLPGGNFISGAMTGASMGAGFGPWGMAAGAALALVNGGIKSLMASEKLHKQESVADFTASTDAIQIMGGKVSDLTDHMKAITFLNEVVKTSSSESQSTLAKGIEYSNTQLEQFNASIKSLPADNSLSLIIKQIKETSDSGDAAKIALQFVTMSQAVNGLSSSQANQLQQLILTAAGKDATTSINSPANQIIAIKNSINSALPNTKQFASVMGQIFNYAMNTTSTKEYSDAIAGIGKSAATSEEQLQGLVTYANTVGDSSLSQLATQLLLKGVPGGASTIATIMKGLQNGHDVTLSNLTGSNYKEYLKSLKDPTPEMAKNIAALAKAKDALSAAQLGNNNASTAGTVATQANVTALTAEQKLLDAKLKSLQDLQKQQTQNTSYATTREDLKNQILMAQATGDNLKAQLLQQQLLSTTGDYNLQNKVDYAQKAADANRLKLDAANVSAQTVNASAQTANTSALTALQKSVDDLTAAVSNGAGVLKTQAVLGTRDNPISKIDSSMIHNDVAGFSGASGKGASDFFKGNKLKKGDFFVADGVLYVDQGNQYVRAQLPNDPTNSKKGVFAPKVSKASGGKISGAGSGTSDSIPAMLSNGEYVINAAAVSHYGVGAFDMLNARHFASGGVARTNSSITFHKQHMNRQARHFATGGYVPSGVAGLATLSRTSYSAGGLVNTSSGNGSGTINHNTYEININGVGKTADDLVKEIFSKISAKEGMSGRKSRVGNN